jgi:putative ABC transport system permease protein
MLLKTALRIIVHEKEKFAGAVAGVAIAVFLMVLQWGFYQGFNRDITIVLDSIDADIWIVPKNQPTFDGWVGVDDLPYYELLEHPGVERAGRLVWGWAACRLPKTGGIDSVEVLGVDFESGIDLRFDLPKSKLAALLRPDGHVMVSDKDREKLGIDSPGVEGMEIFGRMATPVGFVPDVHLFTTAAFILTDLDNARAFLRLPPSHANYLVCKCKPGVDVKRVVAELQRTVREHDVLTAEQFHARASDYWATRTSIGPVLLMSSVLAVSVGFLIVLLAFYISTIEKIPVFACMKALGASGGEIVLLLIFQSLIVFLLGCVVAAGGLYLAVAIIATTTISVVITTSGVAAAVAATGVVSLTSSLLSVRRVITTDPGEAFRT